MSDPWKYARQGFDRGVPRGVRAKERAEDLRFREEDLGLRKESGERAERGLKVQEAGEERAQKEFDAKETVKKARSTLNVARAQVANDNAFAAAKTMTDYYSSQIPNGDEIRVFLREHQADNPAFADVPPEHNVVVQSRTGGIQSFKDLNAVIEKAAAMADVKSITDAYQGARQRLAEKNAAAAETPFMAEDGKYYVNTYTMGPGGVPVQDKQVPYTGKAPAGVRTGLKAGLGREPSEKETQIKLGLREKIEEPKPGEAGKTAKAAADLQGKELDSLKKRLDLALRPFTKGAKSVFDFETGKMVTEGGNAIAEAQKLLDKAEKAPESLTDVEKKNVKKAELALQLYDQIFGSVTTLGGEKQSEGEAPPVEGARKAPDGKWYVQRDGQWYLVEPD